MSININITHRVQKNCSSAAELLKCSPIRNTKNYEISYSLYCVNVLCVIYILQQFQFLYYLDKQLNTRLNVFTIMYLSMF